MMLKTNPWAADLLEHVRRAAATSTSTSGLGCDRPFVGPTRPATWLHRYIRAAELAEERAQRLALNLEWRGLVSRAAHGVSTHLVWHDEPPERAEPWHHWTVRRGMAAPLRVASLVVELAVAPTSRT